MALNVAAKERALSAILMGPLFVGLATEIRDGALIEVKDAAYSRQPISFGDRIVEGPAVGAKNLDVIAFPAFERDAVAPLRYWFIGDSVAGPGILASGELVPRFVDAGAAAHYPQPMAGEAPKFLPGDIEVWVGEPLEG